MEEAKNINKNPIAERAVQESEEAIQHQDFHNKTINDLNPTFYGPLGATPDIRGGTMYPPISYACSACDILMKL